MSTEPPPEDNLNAELDAEGEGVEALSGNNDPDLNAEGNEAEGENPDGGEDHRRSEEDKISGPPESANMVDAEVELMEAALMRCQDFLEKAWAEQELYKNLKNSIKRGSRVTALKKGKGEAGVAADPLRKVSQKSKTGPGLKKPLSNTGKPGKVGPAAPNNSDSKIVWYNWKKSGLLLRIPKDVLVRALRDQVGKAFGDTVDWAAMPVHVLMELVCLFYVSLSNRGQINSLPRWIPDLYGAASYSNQDLFDRIQAILDIPDSGWAAVLTNDGDWMSASINVPDHVKPKQQHCALSKRKSSPVAASKNGGFIVGDSN